MPDQYPPNFFEDAKAGVRPFQDFLWFGIDAIGQIACFTSAGVGLVPMVVFTNRQDYFSVLEAMEQLPRDRGHERQYQGSLESGWAEWADRGLYAYDWGYDVNLFEDNMPYKVEVKPLRPITTSMVPASVVFLLSRVHFKEITFGEDIYIRRHFSDLNNGQQTP